MTTPRWDREDLIRRVLLALNLSAQAVRASAQDAGAPASDRWPAGLRSEVGPLLREKVVGESALLVLTSAHLADLDHRVAAGVDQLARLLGPLARDEDVRTAVCLDPEQALKHSFAHVLLTDAGYPDAAFDDLLEQSVAAARAGERAPTRELEQQWLRGIRTGSELDPATLRRSILAHPLDALAGNAAEHYAFTHAVLYASDAGRDVADLPRDRADVIADADTALAASLDTGNHDLTAELLCVYPMLNQPWTPAAAFAFTMLATTADERGFLPGPAYCEQDRQTLPEALRTEYDLRTSYRTTLTYGILCAVALVRGRRPPAVVPAFEQPAAAADCVYALLGDDERAWRWTYDALDPSRRAGLDDLLVAIALRRARRQVDLSLVRDTLTVALRHGSVDRPAPRQAVGLLRRVASLAAKPGPNAPSRRSGDCPLPLPEPELV